MSGKTYRIGEAAAKLNLKTYVLRFWEMEFSQIAPIRTEKGQRLYREADIAVLKRIRYLLHERGLTIEGARRLLREEAARGVTYADADMALPENFVDGPDDGGDEDAETDPAPREFPRADDPESGNAPSRESLSLPLEDRIDAPAGTDILARDVRDIIAELTIIRSLLNTGDTGDGE